MPFTSHIDQSLDAAALEGIVTWGIVTFFGRELTAEGYLGSSLITWLNKSFISEWRSR